MTLRDVKKQPYALLREETSRLLRTSAAMYMFLAEEAVRQLGDRAEPIIRRHLRRYGEFRGYELREAHRALGLPINMETLQTHWDSASGLISVGDSAGGKMFSPCKTVYDVYECPASVVWQGHNFWRWGHVYCDEFHESCAHTYHPNAHVVIPQNLMKKGDDHCAFTWTMLPDEKEPDWGPVSELGKKLAKNYMPKTNEEAAQKALIRGSRLHGARYATFAKELLAEGPAGEAVLREGLRKFSRYRGEMLLGEHQSLDRHDMSKARMCFAHHDLPYEYLWTSTETEDENGFTLEISYCPLYDVWQDMDALDVGKIYCEETYGALAEGYDLAAIEMQQSQCGGCQTCKICAREKK